MKILKFLNDTKAQTDGGVVGYFIGLMIVVIIAFQVAWPVIDGSLQAPSIGNMSASARMLLGLTPLFLSLVVLMVFIRPIL